MDFIGDPNQAKSDRNKFVLLSILSFSILVGGAIAGYLLWKELGPKSDTVATYDEAVEKASFLEAGGVSRANVSVWLHSKWDSSLGIESLSLHTDSIGVANPVWYNLILEDPDKVVSPYDKQGFMGDAEDVRRLESLALSRKVRLVPTVTNVGTWGVNSAGLVKLLRSDKGFVKQIVNIASKESYSGLDFNLEGVTEKDLQVLADFYKDAARELHKLGKTISVTLDGEVLTPEAQNLWSEIAAVVDGVKVLVYTEHVKANDPGPIASVGWSKKKLEHYLIFIPKEKLVHSMALYGQSWTRHTVGWINPKVVDSRGGAGTGHMYNQGPLDSKEIKLERDSDGNPHWTTKEDVGSFSSRAGHWDDTTCITEHWFEDVVSIRNKVVMAQELGITHFAFWRIGGEDQRIWKMMQGK